MKRIAIAFCLVLSTSALSADEAFLLSIPLRMNAQQETGEVRITLTLAGPPAGTQLVVGSTTLNLGTTQTIAGDSVEFLTGTVANTARIVYRPLSNFAGDFCQGAGAVPKEIQMRFVGPDITKYNVSSYVVAAPAAECAKPSKRAGDMPAQIIPFGDGVAPELSAEDGGRHPLDVVVVLDKSGSMNERPPGADAGPTKAELLTSAMGTFVATWQEIDVLQSNDRLGVVFFSNTAAAQTITGGDPPAGFFVRRGTDPAGATHDWNAVRTKIEELTPGGATSVGAGINSGMQQWSSDPESDLSLLVVTDGKQNTAPLIEPAASGFLALTPVGTFTNELRQRFVPIQSIGFGEPGTVDGELLTKLALETSGVSYISINVATLFDNLALTLISILKGNTAALALRHHHVLSGTTPGPFKQVPVDKSVQRAVFSVQWAPPRVNALELDVVGPGGQVMQPDSMTRTPQSFLLSFDMEPKHVGTWRVRARRPQHLSSAPAPVDVPYTVHTYFVERHLDFSVSVAERQPATGDALTIRARVSYDGRPLARLPEGAIKVRVQRPADGLGNILRRTRGSNGASTAGGDLTTAYDRKVARMPKSALAKIIPADVETITLQHEKNGLYSGTFKGTTVPGLYGFEAVLEWDDPRTGKLRREERLETHVTVRPDLRATEIVASGNTRGVVTFRVTPRDRFGNFLGPGYASRLRARVTGRGSLVQKPPEDPDQNGTYFFVVRDVPAEEKLKLTVTVD
ncbi:MAG TPA: vWA domain-containing protein [Thermoanaerobaculia bacterium]